MERCCIPRRRARGSAGGPGAPAGANESGRAGPPANDSCLGSRAGRCRCRVRSWGCLRVGCRWGGGEGIVCLVSGVGERAGDGLVDGRMAWDGHVEG